MNANSLTEYYKKQKQKRPKQAVVIVTGCFCILNRFQCQVFLAAFNFKCAVHPMTSCWTVTIVPSLVIALILGDILYVLLVAVYKKYIIHSE